MIVTRFSLVLPLISEFIEINFEQCSNLICMKYIHEMHKKKQFHIENFQSI